MNRYHLIIAASATIALTLAIATEPQANVDTAQRVSISAKADRLDIEQRRDPCRLLAWPYISGECVARSNPLEEPRIATRTVTIEHRPQPGVSVLSRVPVEDVAER